MPRFASKSRAFLAAAAFAAAALAPLAVLAQTMPGSNPQGRDCKTVRTCNFDRNAEVRGCLSSYSCRTCEPVATRCRIGNATGTCRQFRCSWGG